MKLEEEASSTKARAPTRKSRAAAREPFPWRRKWKIATEGTPHMHEPGRIAFAENGHARESNLTGFAGFAT